LRGPIRALGYNSSMPKAVFFDLGSTLWDDYPAELHIWEALPAFLADYGVSTSLAEIIEVSKDVIRTYSPSLTRSIIWRYVDGDRDAYRTVVEKVVVQLKQTSNDPDLFRRFNPLFPGVPELLEKLSSRYHLAVVSQQFSEVERWMGYHGINQYFRHLSISGKEHLYKPDPRLFELPCNALNIPPHEVVMVGDRLDNDIWPANRLGMTTVRILADPYRIQQPRYHTDVPDYTYANTADCAELLLN